MATIPDKQYDIEYFSLFRGRMSLHISNELEWNNIQKVLSVDIRILDTIFGV